MVAKAKAINTHPHGVNVSALVDAVIGVPLTKLRQVVNPDPNATSRAVFGTGNTKTGSPGTYRAVGEARFASGTCPKTCEHLRSGSCYAMLHHVGEAGRRAGSEPAPALRSFAAACALAVRRTILTVKRASLRGRSIDLPEMMRLVRLHVSGDVGGSDGSVDTEYVRGLALIASSMRSHLRSSLVSLGLPESEVNAATGYVSWSYTHFSPGPWTDTLREAGIAVRISDTVGPWGTVTVADRAHARSLSSRRQVVAVCPAQLSEQTCRECGLCWRRPDITIAFLAHGGGAKRAATWASERFVSTAK